MTEDAANQLLANHSWTFAKTMPQNPHDYTLRHQWTDDEFDQIVMFIREHGVREMFKGYPYIVWYSGDYKYWTMGAPLEQTILINRAKADKDD